MLNRDGLERRARTSASPQAPTAPLRGAAFLHKAAAQTAPHFCAKQRHGGGVTAKTRAVWLGPDKLPPSNSSKNESEEALRTRHSVPKAHDRQPPWF